MTEDHRSAQEPDAALARVRAADPAATAEPDAAALDAAVRARIAEPEDELAAARGRRRSRGWFPIAAAAAGALVFASAGYALGNAGPAGDATTAGAAISLGQGAADQSTTLGAPEVAKSAAGASRDSASSLAWPGYGGRTVFTASGLSDDGGTATAWAYDPTSVFSAATANAIATALGLAGQAELIDGAWTVGPNDGTAPMLSLQPDALASVNYYNPGLDPYACQAAVSKGSGAGSDGSTGSAGSDPVAPEGATTDTPVSPLPDPGQTCAATTLPPAPQGDAAVARAKDLFGSLGVDASSFEFEAQDSGQVESSYVTAYQVIDAQRTGASWSVSLVGDGVQSLNGSLAHVVSLGTYDVVSPSAAVARLTDPRFGSSYGGPMYAMERSVIADDSVASGDAATAMAPDATSEIAPAPARTLPPTVQPGSALSWPVYEVTLTSARLGLTMSTQADGATVLLPAYELSSGDGQIWSVLAVADAQLDFTPAG